MSLEDYRVDKDQFHVAEDKWGEVKFTGGLSFPCCVCKNATKGEDCKECKMCQHNVNSSFHR